MANKTDVTVKNIFKNNETFQVKRLLPDGNSEFEVKITQGEVKMVSLPSVDVALVIQAPVHMDLRDCPIKVQSDVDMEIRLSRTQANWTFTIIPNELPPDVPTTTNVTVGQDEPD